MSAFPRCLKISYLATSMQSEIFGSESYSDIIKDSTTFKSPSNYGNVGRLMYNKKVSEKVGVTSQASQNFTFSISQKLDV